MMTCDIENNICNCKDPVPIEKIQNPYCGKTSICKNCDHIIYFQGATFKPRWEHLTRQYKPYGYPFTTIECYGPKNENGFKIKTLKEEGEINEIRKENVGLVFGISNKKEKKKKIDENE